MLSQFCGPTDVITPDTAEDDALRRALGYPGAQNFDLPFRWYGPKDWARLVIKRRRPDPFTNHRPAKLVRQSMGRRTWDRYFTFCIERNPWDKVVSAYHFLRVKRSLHDFVMSERIKRFRDWDHYTEDGRVIVDHVARFENLQTELTDICARLGLPWDGVLPRAKGGFRTDRRPYWELMGTAERDRIAEVFAPEIEYFGYTFVPSGERDATEAESLSG
jgi:hypothetical protein